MSALPGWFQWRGGERYRLSRRHPWCRYEGSDACDDDGEPVTESPPSQRSPLAEVDPTDPATLGCLTARVREMWGAPVVARMVGVFPDGRPEWAVCDLPDREPMYGYRSEWAALMAAGDAAWAREVSDV